MIFLAFYENMLTNFERFHFSVTLTDTQELATYVIRTFNLQRVSSLNVSIPFLFYTQYTRPILLI